MVGEKSHDQGETTGAFVWHPALTLLQICFEQGWVQSSAGTWPKEGLAAALLQLCFVPVPHKEIPSLTGENNPPFPAQLGSRRWVARPTPSASGGVLRVGLGDSHGSLPARDVLVPKHRSARAEFPYHDVVCSAAGRAVCGGRFNTGFAAPALAASGFALTPPLPFWADEALFSALAIAPHSSLLRA